MLAFINSAQTIRAILFASATVTSICGLRASICSSQEPGGAPRMQACYDGGGPDDEEAA